MNLVKSILIAVLILMVSSVEAKPLKTNKVYMFGFSASFKDSVVYVTEIQNVQEAWIDTKTKFLLGRPIFCPAQELPYRQVESTRTSQHGAF